MAELEPNPGSLVSIFRWLNHRWSERKRSKLRLCETLSLGEKRFVAVVEFESSQFLLGGTSHSITLLSQLPAHASRTSEEPQ